jgi:dihydrofolate synthase/folylpolyglutamate synthase
VSAPARWSLARAEAHLRSLELFGMRFGLQRIRRLLTALGSPQRDFAAVHVVGTNGKSSTTRMTAAILAEHGLRTGAYLSPHLRSYTERIQIAGVEVEAALLAEGLQRAVHAAEQVNRTLAEDDHVTQFELLTAAAFFVLSRREVEVAVIEAGLGGRYDATNVLDAPVCVLTNVTLEHTRWLGPTVRDIATEKLAVVPPGARLVLGPRVDRRVLALARKLEREAGVKLVRARTPQAGRRSAQGGRTGASAGGAGEPGESAGGAGAWAAPYQARNLATARAAASCMLEHLGRDFDERAFERASAHTIIAGRFQRVHDDPPTIFDGAHNPAAAQALAEALQAHLRKARLALVLGVLEDKDAVGILRALLPLVERAWFTAPPGPRALPPATLASLARQLGFERSECRPRPASALAGASEWAREHDGCVVATGSIYLLGELFGALADGRSARHQRAGER